MTSGPAFRLARAAIFAAVCVVTAALGHALMSGPTLSGWAVGYAFAGTTAGAWWLTGRERGAVTVTGSTVATQLGLHGLFNLSQSMTVARAPGIRHMDIAGIAGITGMAGMAGRDMSAMHHAAGHGWSVGMFLAHTLAAALCGLWLWRGEAAAFRLGRSLAAFVFAPLRFARRTLAYAGRPGLVAHPVTADGAPRRPRGLLLTYVVSRRGPPELPVRR